MPTLSPQPQTTQRLRLHVHGVVQGVGFRPFVYNLAVSLGLTGFVGNDSAGVYLEIEGAPAQVQAFQDHLQSDPPPLSHIEELSVTALEPVGAVSFEIVHSAALPGASTLISPDVAVCADCLREMRNPADRRFGYPFINCTNCGPRFTIIRDLPYDRPQTTMAGFTMCPACRREYDDPADRRFHAQPNACPVCGPQLHFLAGIAATPLIGPAALNAALHALGVGKIVAVKGLGGYHLACDARNESAVALLRERKRRGGKPFALMARDLAVVRATALLDPAEERLISGPERPIVLLERLPAADVAPSVAPGNGHLGIMLPYTPLHHLLFAEHTPSLLVLTSANDAGEPIVYSDGDAFTQLASLADAWLLHDRPIHLPADDSVIRVFEGQELPVRRSRGYAPFPVRLPFAIPPVLAVGGELKSTFCIANGRYAYMSQHIGDMANLETLEAMERAVTHFATIFRTTPELLACDTHPGYLSAQWAARHAAGRPLVAVQHHHAHIAALMAEHGLPVDARVIGLSFDGTGYGDDGAIWGGELLLAGYISAERLGHLAYVPLPGGDSSVKRPYRIALAHLHAAGIPWDSDLPPVIACAPVERKVLARQLESGFTCVPTSSMGRLFDAVAALLGVRQVVSYEAQAAIEFEALHRYDNAAPYPFELRAGAPLRVDYAPLLHALVADMRADIPLGVIASRFHSSIAAIAVALAAHARERSGLNCVALSGGVFQNIVLLRLVATGLRAAGFEVLVHRKVPPNDGGLALGQAMIAAVRHQQRG
ncbi:MAG: carbamoyltransferase HypF [Oscillochloris sp.]|nr:carbamoyltransferase HypF [Oscillochloris sp.]